MRICHSFLISVDVFIFIFLFLFLYPISISISISPRLTHILVAPDHRVIAVRSLNITGEFYQHFDFVAYPFDHQLLKITLKTKLPCTDSDVRRASHQLYKYRERTIAECHSPPHVMGVRGTASTVLLGQQHAASVASLPH